MLDFIAPAGIGIDHRPSRIADPAGTPLAAPRPSEAMACVRGRDRARDLSALLAIALTLPAGAADPAGPGLSPLDPQLPWTVEADHLTYDPARDEYIAEGNVLLAKLDRTIGADRVRYSQRDMMAFAEGHVIVTARKRPLSGSYLEMDLESEKGYLDDGTIFMSENNYHLSGDRIEKVGADLYTIDRGVVTTCDGDPPDWKIGGSDIKVHDDGAGSAWNALVYARDIPLLYFALCVVPGQGSPDRVSLPRDGIQLTQGVFLLPAVLLGDRRPDGRDLLPGVHELPGLETGTRVPLLPHRDAKGAVMFDYLHDDQIDNGEGNSNNDWGYNTTGIAAEPRPILVPHEPRQPLARTGSSAGSTWTSPATRTT